MEFKPLKEVQYLAVHCAATPPNMDIGVKEITLWHRARGFSTIGYHYVIRRSGAIEKGRPDDVPGAHVLGYNHLSLGVCMVGGIDAHGNPQNNFTPDQFSALAALLKRLKASYPNAIVQGHRDFPGVTKACPSFDVKPWWASVENGGGQSEG